MQSDNPLLNKKIVKTTLKTQAYSTPWDQPHYKEEIVSKQKYSKIENVYEIPYLKNTPAYKTGDFLTRFNICVEKKKNLKQTLDGINKRYNDLMAILNKDLDKTFAGNPTPEQKSKIEQTSQAILDARTLYPDCSLADLYDELTMPPELRKAHQNNDRAVMAAYGFSIKMTESECVAELMKLYQELTETK